MKVDDATVKSEDKEKGCFPETKSRKRKRTRKHKDGSADSQKYMEVLKELETVKREFLELKSYVSRSLEIRRLLVRLNKPKLLVDLNAYFQEPYIPKAFDDKNKGVIAEVPQSTKN